MPPGISSRFNLLNVVVNVTYTLDVFGGIRRQIEAAKAQSKYQQFQLEATYLTVTADVVVTAAILEASLRGRIRATLRLLINDEHDQLSIVQSEFDLGGASQADVTAQQTALAQTEARLPPLNKQIERDLLRLPTGHFPGDDVGANFVHADLALPQNLPLSLASQLVEQPPDVRQYQALLQVASADVGVATAHMLPQFTMSGGLGTYAAKGVYRAILAWSAADGVAQPIFESGTLLHRRRAAIEAYNQALAEYQYTVLVDFQKVADSLQALETDAYALKADAIAERSASESLKLARDQNLAGYIPYLSLPVAENSYQQTIISLLQAEATRYPDTTALFQALGDRWRKCTDVVGSCNSRQEWKGKLP